MYFFTIDSICATIDRATSNPIKVGVFGIISTGISFVYIPIIPIVLCISIGLLIGSVVNKYTVNNIKLTEEFEENGNIEHYLD